MRGFGQEMYRFAGFTFDTVRGLLLGLDGNEIRLRPKSFCLLRFLLTNSGRLIPKDELMAALWPRVIVGDDSLMQCVSDLRSSLGDIDRRIIRTIPRRGYLFTVPVSSEGREGSAETRSSAGSSQQDEGDPGIGTAAGREDGLGLPDKPSIAVLPFANLSSDPEQDYFVDGMVEEIITALSCIRWLFVIARNSSFTYKGHPVDVTQVGRELGVRYVLKGSVRKSGNRLRIAGQLIDAANRTHLWADRFDGSLEDVFELQDKVASSVAGIIEPTLQAAETARSADRPTDDLTAYDLYLRAYATVFTSSRQIPEALSLLEQAIARDPRYGPALAWAAVCCNRLITDGRSGGPAADRLKGADFARRALEAARDDPSVLANAAQVLGYLGEDIDAMMALADRALAINPNFARGWVISGHLRMMSGRPDIAIQHLDAALRLSPRGRIGAVLAFLGIAHFLSRHFDEAVPKLRLAMQDDPSAPQPYRWLTACYAHMGRLDDAREIMSRLRAITPLVIPYTRHLRNAEHRDLFLSGLHLAAGSTE
jgi:TolB-like protein/DNA-binding winged helix-turn-helix (wHTH) protein